MSTSRKPPPAACLPPHPSKSETRTWCRSASSVQRKNGSSNIRALKIRSRQPRLSAFEHGSIQTGLQSRPVWMDLTLKSLKPRRCPGFTTEFHRWITAFHVPKSAEFRPLTGFIHRRRTGRANAVDDSTQVTRTLKVTPLPRWFSPRAIRIRQLARSPPPVMDAYFRSWPLCARRHVLLRCPAATYPLGRILRQPVPVSFSRKETGTSTTAAALIAHGFAAFPLVTIGVTNADVTSNSLVDDGAADQGMDCT